MCRTGRGLTLVGSQDWAWEKMQDLPVGLKKLLPIVQQTLYSYSPVTNIPMSL